MQFSLPVIQDPLRAKTKAKMITTTTTTTSTPPKTPGSQGSCAKNLLRKSSQEKRMRKKGVQAKYRHRQSPKLSPTLWKIMLQKLIQLLAKMLVL